MKSGRGSTRPVTVTIGVDEEAEEEEEEEEVGRGRFTVSAGGAQAGRPWACCSANASSAGKKKTVATAIVVCLLPARR